jgi:7,8-dihydropterin-6-yl-methyl-4-(beta-D-ribofuranosyl)aminobenzene 5'-phosphate synthase
MAEMGTGLRRCDSAFWWQRWCAVCGAFTTGHIPRQSFARVLENTLVESENGAGPSPDHFTDAEHLARLARTPRPRPASGRTRDLLRRPGTRARRHLFVRHVGLINTIKDAMAVSGVGKLHAVLGGFHIGPAPQDYVDHTVAELERLSPDVAVPMHCSGAKFLAAMHRQMPDRLVTANIGSRFALGV